MLNVTIFSESTCQLNHPTFRILKLEHCQPNVYLLGNLNVVHVLKNRITRPSQPWCQMLYRIDLFKNL